MDTGDTDYLSSRMAALRGRTRARPGAAGKVLCDTASSVPAVLGRGRDQVRTDIINRQGASSTSPRFVDDSGVAPDAPGGTVDSRPGIAAVG